MYFVLSQQYYTPYATSCLHKLNLTPNFGSASYQLSLHRLNCHENSLRLRSTVPLFSTGARVFQAHFHYLSPIEEDGYYRRLIHSTGFGRRGQPEEDEEAALNRSRQDRSRRHPRPWRGTSILIPTLV